MWSNSLRNQNKIFRACLHTLSDIHFIYSRISPIPPPLLFFLIGIFLWLFSQNSLRPRIDGPFWGTRLNGIKNGDSGADPFQIRFAGEL